MFRRNRTTFAGSFAARQPRTFRPLIEDLEHRQLLSASLGHAPAGPAARGPAPVASFAKLQTSNPKAAVSENAHCGGAGATVVGTDLTASTMTVSNTNKDGTTTQATYTVSPTATITADGAAVTLDQLVAGVKVRFTTDPTDATVVTAIKATGTEVEGRLASVDTTAGTITLSAKKGGTATTYTIPSTATVTVNGVATSLLDALLVVGSRVEIRFSALDATNIVAVAVH